MLDNKVLAFLRLPPKACFFGKHFLKLQMTDIQLITLPPLKSDLAKAACKDPYNFGFVDMTKVKQETDLEDQLTTKVTDFFAETWNRIRIRKKTVPTEYRWGREQS